MQDFKKLNVWNKSHLLAINIYRATSSFPKSELYGLTSQIRSACVSVPANIAEGCGRDSNADFGHFLQISLGSAHEVQYYILLAHDLKLLNDNDYDNLDSQINEIKRMLITLIKTVKSEKVYS
ncbi:MAG: four helix bundle protein [Desulfotomaculaceae bacterium]